MKKTFYVLAVGLVALALAAFLWHNWKQNEPRRHSFQAIQNFSTALNSGNGDALLRTVVLPAAVTGRTSAEQVEFLIKALRDEISPEGLAVLWRDGKFGPLQELFPQEAPAWTAQAGVNPEDCVAYKLERNGVHAEVVLVKRPGVQQSESTAAFSYRIVRCNNVKQLAEMPITKEHR